MWNLLCQMKLMKMYLESWNLTIRLAVSHILSSYMTLKGEHKQRIIFYVFFLLAQPPFPSSFTLLSHNDSLDMEAPALRIHFLHYMRSDLTLSLTDFLTNVSSLLLLCAKAVIKC